MAFFLLPRLRAGAVFSRIPTFRQVHKIFKQIISNKISLFAYYVLLLDRLPSFCIFYAMTEHAKAKAWREKRGLTVDKLAELTGYGPRMIFWMELGQSPPSGSRKATKVAPWVWQRYKMMCAGVEAQLKTGKEFDW